MNKYEEALDVIARYISDSKHWIARYSENTINEKLSHLKELIDKEEKALDKACYELMRFAECDRCPMKDDHCMITNWQCKDKWKEWLLKDE